MLAENFYQILDQLTKWRLATFPGSAGSTGRPPNDPDAAPDNPYPVVDSFNPTPTTCEWCQSICTKHKLYVKINNSNNWRASCGDCKQKRIVTTKEMIKNGSFTIAKLD